MQNSESDGIHPVQLYRLTNEERDELIKCVEFAVHYHVLGDDIMLARIAKNLQRAYKTAKAPVGTFNTPPIAPVPDTPAPEPKHEAPPENLDALAQAKYDNGVKSIKKFVNFEIDKSENAEVKEALQRVLAKIENVL